MPWLVREAELAGGEARRGLLYVHIPRCGGTSMSHHYAVARQSREGRGLLAGAMLCCGTAERYSGAVAATAHGPGLPGRTRQAPGGAARAARARDEPAEPTGPVEPKYYVVEPGRGV